MSSLTFGLCPAPLKADVQFLYDRVRGHNKAVSGLGPPESYAIYLRDEEEKIVGGVEGQVWGMAVYIAALWVAEAYREHGHGTALMTQAEAYAREQGCRLSYLETLSFQARPFYEKLGYEVFGQLEEITDGCTLYFLRKSLRPTGPSTTNHDSASRP